MAQPKPTPEQLREAADFREHQARLVKRAESALEFVLVLLGTVFGAMALVHFLTPCATTAHLCWFGALLARVRQATPVPEHQATELACEWSPAQLHPEAQPSPLPMLASALRAQYEAGEREGYIAGTRWGAICGACLGFPLGLLTAIGLFLAGARL